MKRSKVIITENGSKHRSRLIKAIQSLDNLDDYALMPQGVWGSTATIKCGGVTIKSSELDFEFEVPFDDNLESKEGNITIYNLSDNTIKQLKKDMSISIEAGYEGDTGVIFKGYIAKPSTRREGADKVTTLKIIDSIYQKESLDIAYASGTTASYILRDLFNRTKLSFGKFEVERDHTYGSGVNIDEPLESAIKRFSEICGISTWTSKGKIYSCGLKKVSNIMSFARDNTFDVSENTGMIGSPSPFEEQNSISVEDKDYIDTLKGFEIEMLMQHRAAVGAVVNLKSEQYTGKYYIKSGVHRFNTSECITTIKVVA